MKKVIIILSIVVIVGAGYYWRDSIRGVFGGAGTVPAPQTGSGATPEAIAEITKYEYTETYNDTVRKFTFKYPTDFIVTNIPDESSGSEAVLVQNVTKDIGVQILISPFDAEDVNLTADSVRANLPDLSVSEPQELLIGTDRKGVAFKSNNESFGGSSREVWFVYNGFLYQISTYADLDEFLKGLFATWQFQ